MPQIQRSTSVSLGDKTYEVAQLPQQLQDTIAYFDDWRQNEADAVSQLAMVRAALRDAQNAIVADIRAWEAQQENSDTDTAQPEASE